MVKSMVILVGGKITGNEKMQELICQRLKNMLLSISVEKATNLIIQKYRLRGNCA